MLGAGPAPHPPEDRVLRRAKAFEVVAREGWGFACKNVSAVDRATRARVSPFLIFTVHGTDDEADITATCRRANALGGYDLRGEFRRPVVALGEGDSLKLCMGFRADELRVPPPYKRLRLVRHGDDPSLDRYLPAMPTTLRRLAIDGDLREQHKAIDWTVLRRFVNLTSVDLRGMRAPTTAIFCLPPERLTTLHVATDGDFADVGGLARLTSLTSLTLDVGGVLSPGAWPASLTFLSIRRAGLWTSNGHLHECDFRGALKLRRLLFAPGSIADVVRISLPPDLYQLVLNPPFAGVLAGIPWSLHTVLVSLLYEHVDDLQGVPNTILYDEDILMVPPHDDDGIAPP